MGEALVQLHRTIISRNVTRQAGVFAWEQCTVDSRDASRGHGRRNVQKGSVQRKRHDAAEHEHKQSGGNGHIDWITHASLARAFRQPLS
jgi:hypothetical protein